jgi:large subunit ribosomal protein L29e
MQSASTEAITALMIPKTGKPKMPKGPNRKLRHLAFTADPKLGKQIRSYMAKDHRLRQPKPRVQDKA